MVVTNIGCDMGRESKWHWKTKLTDNDADIKYQSDLEEKFSTSKSDDDDDFYTSLVNEGRFVPGDDNELVPLEEIPWIDKSLINESITFHQKYFSLVLLSNTFALMLGFAIKPNSAVLLKTGKLHNPELSFQRYLSTIQRIGQFFTFPFDWEQAHKSFQIVRKMHALASKKPLDSLSSPELLHEPWKTELTLAMRKDLDHLDTSSAPTHALTWNPPVPVSQFDMATTQFGFWGTIWLFPKVFGVQNREKEMKGVIHVWAIFGRLLGIRDEYNICLKPNPQLYQKLFTNVVVASLKSMDETVVTIQSAFVEALSKRMPFVSYKSMLYFGLQEYEGYKGENLWKLMSWRDKVNVKVMNVFMWMMRTSGVFRVSINLLFGFWLQVQFWLHLPNVFWPSPKFIWHKMK